MRDWHQTDVTPEGEERQRGGGKEKRQKSRNEGRGVRKEERKNIKENIEEGAGEWEEDM